MHWRRAHLLGSSAAACSTMYVWPAADACSSGLQVSWLGASLVMAPCASFSFRHGHRAFTTRRVQPRCPVGVGHTARGPARLQPRLGALIRPGHYWRLWSLHLHPGSFTRFGFRLAPLLPLTGLGGCAGRRKRQVLYSSLVALLKSVRLGGLAPRCSAALDVTLSAVINIIKTCGNKKSETEKSPHSAGLSWMGVTGSGIYAFALSTTRTPSQ